MDNTTKSGYCDFTEDILPFLRTNLEDWDMYHSFGKTNSRGCSIYIQKKLTYTLINTITDTEGRLLIVNIELSDTVYTLINIYAHNDRTQRNDFFLFIKQTYP